jgi:glycosyltransferase involved in cell wall biosynthesis
MGGADHLWGKEFVVARLMREQRANGRLDPQLITFSPSLLGTMLASEGFQVDVLSSEHTHGFADALSDIPRILRRQQSTIVHSHGYRANIVAKMLRLTGRARGIRVISTQHGWVNSSRGLRVYNAIDRFTTFLSDATTVPDRNMLMQLNRAGNCSVIANCVPDLNAEKRPEQERRSGQLLIVGILGRVCAAKGIHELLAAAQALNDGSVSFLVAGDGDMSQQVRDAGGFVHFMGYVADSESFLDAIDIFVQASHSEGLSLSLLEAMRAGKAIVATDVGGTASAVRHEESALLIPARDTGALRAALERLRADPELRRRLGNNARAKFETEFRMEKQHDAFLQIYFGEPQLTNQA